ncbi:MAG: alanine racemase, partial [Flavobacteriales bacterium]|nr:alanine racemase [Flavobacteriales bacterium]
MKINQPTLLVDREKALANIRMMVGRAESGRVRFRPHFKTHQSAEIGEWFRSEGVRQITVSSLDMALYFADHGWMDITVAFPVNILEIDKINVLAQRITLNLVVHSADAVTFLDKHLNHPVNVWVKVDVGTHRSGMSPGNLTAISDVVKRIVRAGRLTPVGLLAHAGHTYGMREKESIQEVFRGTRDIMQHLSDQLLPVAGNQLELSVGDTPGCCLTESFEGVDEIRPGNFVFFDVMQAVIGSCKPEQIAVAMACPVVGVFPERGELLIYGGGVHLSKDSLNVDGRTQYGWLTDFRGG